MQRTLRRAYFSRSQWIAGAVALAVASPAAAHTIGITGFSGQQPRQDGMPLYCSNAGTGCHFTDPGTGTKAPMVRFDGPTQIDPDAQATYTFTVTSENPQVQIQAGLDVAASAGTLGALPGQQEQLLQDLITHAGEITHTGPKDNDQNGEASWQFTWHAPSTPGVYVLFGAGNSVDGLMSAGGDEAAITTLMITVGNPAPTPTPAACAGDCNGDGTVSVNELVLAVNIALGALPATDCLAVDTDGNGVVSITELVAAVNGALNGC